MFSQKKTNNKKNGTDAKSFYTLITLPSHLRGYVKYVVVLLPLNGCTYSLGIKYICQSEGARELLQRLDEQRDRKHKKPLHAFLCSSAATGTICPYGWSCTEIHCTLEGFRAKRSWDRPVKAIRSLKAHAGDGPAHLGPAGEGSSAHGADHRAASIFSMASDQGTEESLSDRDSTTSDEDDLKEGDYSAAERTPSSSFNAMSQEQIMLGCTVHDPYALPLNEPAPEKPIHIHAFSAQPSFDCSPARNPSQYTASIARGLLAQESFLVATQPFSPLCCLRGCPCLRAPDAIHPIQRPLAISAPLPPPTPGRSSAPNSQRCPPTGWSADHVFMLQQSLSRVRSKVQSGYLSFDCSGAPSSSDEPTSAASVQTHSSGSSSSGTFSQSSAGFALLKAPGASGRAAALCAASPVLAARSWADEVDEACEMDFSCPLLSSSA